MIKLNVNCVPESLRDFFSKHQHVGIAYSGGCDSSYLLYAALACGARAHAYFVQSAFQAEFELEDAGKTCEELGVELRIIALDVLSDTQVRANTALRCYHCKHLILRAILDAASSDGCETVLDGTNASDGAEERPGMRALNELRVLSPLRECAITKAELRMYARDAGLSVWNKPAYACLATRIPEGTPIEKAALERINRGEKAMRKMGFSDFRLRVTERGCRIEICEAELMSLIEARKDVLNQLQDEFSEITLNLRTRGS